jgi:hypothetical protein
MRDRHHLMLQIALAGPAPIHTTIIVNFIIDCGARNALAKPVVAIDIIHFWQKKLVDDSGSLKIEQSSLILPG